MAVKQLTETPVHTMYARRTEIRMGKNPTHVKQNPRFILRVPSAYLRYNNCLQSEQFMGVVSLKICRLYQFLSMRWKLLLKMSGKKIIWTLLSPNVSLWLYKLFLTQTVARFTERPLSISSLQSLRKEPVTAQGLCG